MKSFFKPFMFLPFAFALLAGCSNNNSATAPGAGDWELVTEHAPFAGRYGLTGTVFNGLMWVLGGASGPVTTYYSDVWSSGSGSSWGLANGSAPFGGRYGSGLLALNGKMYLIGGNRSGVLQNDVWSSPDGANWTLIHNSSAASATQFSAREDFGYLVFNNQLWVIGGYSGKSEGDVWSSPDGVAWTRVSAGGGAGQFAARWGLASAVFNSQMWVFGGASGGTGNTDPTQGYGDAWFSGNGSNWTKATQYAGYGLLYFHQVVPFTSQLLMTAGYQWNHWGGQFESDTSSDGVTWAVQAAKFPQRYFHLSLAFNSYAWVIAGANDYCPSPGGCPISYLNDVWRHK